MCFYGSMLTWTFDFQMVATLILAFNLWVHVETCAGQAFWMAVTLTGHWRKSPGELKKEN